MQYDEVLLAARRAARAAQQAQESSLAELAQLMRDRLRRILVVTDRPFWFRANYVDELIAQMIEYLSHIGPVIVCAVGWRGIQTTSIFAEFKCIEMDSDAELASAISELQSHCHLSNAVVFASDSVSRAIMAVMERQKIETWRMALSFCPTNEQVKFESDEREFEAIVAAPLRYAPLSSERTLSHRHVSIFHSVSPSEWDAVVLQYISDRCADLKLRLTVVIATPYAEYDKEFFRASTTGPASRVVLLLPDSICLRFLIQSAQYRQASWIAISENCVFPQAFGPDGKAPSIVRSIDRFLEDELVLAPAPDGNSGWSKLWSRLEFRLTHGTSIKS
jgi:hypothetical protein